MTKKLLLILVILVLIGLSNAGTWLVLTKRASKQDAGKRELDKTLAKVGRLIELPRDEEPTLATVTDKSKLTDPFLSHAENGDKVLIYYKAKKAIIYRPGSNKIIQVGPLLLDPGAEEVIDTKIVIRNGTRTDTLTAQVEGQIKATYPQVNIISTGPASRSDFPSTIVIDLTEGRKKYNFVASLAQIIGGQRGILPLGEDAPVGADILIIIGNDHWQLDSGPAPL